MTSINEQLNDTWEDGYLIDNMFNNLMDNGDYGNKRQSKYIDKIVHKFRSFRVKSPSTYFEIDVNDLDVQTIKQIEDCVKGCKTPREKYLKLDGIIVEVISQIAKQAEPMILSQRVDEDTVWIKASLNKIRELVTLKWKLIGGKKMGSPIDDIIGYSPDVNDDSPTSITNTVYKIVEHGIHCKVYYIDENLGHICYGNLKDSDIHPLKSIINILPKKLTYYNNPIFPKAEPKVQLEFNDTLKRENNIIKIGPCSNLSELIKTLENSGYILYRNKASDAFNSVVSAMKEKGMVEYVEDVTTAGYYLVNEQLVKKDTTQKQTDISKEDAEKCCQLLDKLAGEEGAGWLNKKIFPTVLKWAIVSPFSFVIKQSNKNNFLPWLMLYGQSKSGKSTLGEISSRIWRLKDNDKGFPSIDTQPKLGQTLSQNTYPILINEVGVLSSNNNFGKYAALIEMMKNSVTGLTARSKFINYSNYTEIPALSPLVLTSNHKVIEDSGFLRRFIVIHFTRDEEKSTEEQANFNKLELDALCVLGDFVSQDISIDVLKKDWKASSAELLKDFYRFAGRETIPKWIDLFEEQKDIEDEVNEKKHFELRAFLIEKITSCYRLNNRSFSSDTDTEINKDMMSALNFCLKNKLIPFLHEKHNSDNEIIITIDIMNEINIPNIAAFKDVSSIIGFEYTTLRIGESKKPMKVLKGNREDFCKFLDLGI